MRTSDRHEGLSTAGFGDLATALHAELRTSEPFQVLAWDNGDWCRCHVNGRTFHIDYVFSQGGGRLVELAERLPAFLRAAGLRAIATTMTGPESREWIERVGLEERSGVFEVDLADRCRVDEYAAWKVGSGAEPPWHQTVAARWSASREPGDLY